jgi:hypothetical protein
MIWIPELTNRKAIQAVTNSKATNLTVFYFKNDTFARLCFIPILFFKRAQFMLKAWYGNIWRNNKKHSTGFG